MLLREEEQDDVLTEWTGPGFNDPGNDTHLSDITSTILRGESFRTSLNLWDGQPSEKARRNRHILHILNSSVYNE